jgi:hypothetical protein
MPTGNRANQGGERRKHTPLGIIARSACRWLCRMRHSHLPQGADSSYAHSDVVAPAPGKWTVFIWTRPAGTAGSYTGGTVQFTWAAENYVNFGSLQPAVFNLAPGASEILTAQFSMPMQSGDLAAAIRFGQSADLNGTSQAEIPISLRTLISIGPNGGNFTGTLTGGNGRGGGAPTQTYAFDVPTGVNNMSLVLSIADSGYVLEGLLVDPQGMELSVNVNLGPECKNAPELLMHVTMHGKPLCPFPSANRADAAVEIGRDGFPRAQPVSHRFAHQLCPAPAWIGRLGKMGQSGTRKAILSVPILVKHLSSISLHLSPEIGCCYVRRLYAHLHDRSSPVHWDPVYRLHFTMQRCRLRGRERGVENTFSPGDRHRDGLTQRRNRSLEEADAERHDPAEYRDRGANPTCAESM